MEASGKLDMCKRGDVSKLLKRLERVKGIEPSSSAWKAVALPLSYTRSPTTGGGGRTRTYEGVSQRIYSPPPLPLGTLPRRTSHPRGCPLRRDGGFMGSPWRGVNRRRGGLKPCYCGASTGLWYGRGSPCADRTPTRPIAISRASASG